MIKEKPKTYKRILVLITVFVTGVASAVAIAIFLDKAELNGTKQSIGVIGTFFILLSFIYSARKRYFKFGRMKQWLQFHQVMTICGTTLLFIHASWHAHALIPLLSLAVMTVAVISGLIGAYLYQVVRGDLKQQKEAQKNSCCKHSKKEIENQIALLTSTSKLMGKWHKYHNPIVEVLLGLVIIHIVSAVYYTGRIW